MNMSKASQKSIRPLGMVKLERRQSDSKDIGKIIGCAMQIPPPQNNDRSVPPSNSSSKRSSIASLSSDAGDIDGRSLTGKNEVHLKNAIVRERKLKSKLSDAEKIIQQLKDECAGQIERIATFEVQVSVIEQEKSSWKGKYENEKHEHDITKESLALTVVQFEELKTEHQKLKRSHVVELSDLKNSLESKIALLEETKKTEIEERDKKLERLKQQMADALQGNSWERQQQLEELTKELSRMQDETETLRMKLRQHGKRNSEDCTMCQSYVLKLETANKWISEKTKIIEDLQGHSKDNNSNKQRD